MMGETNGKKVSGEDILKEIQKNPGVAEAMEMMAFVDAMNPYQETYQQFMATTAPLKIITTTTSTIPL